MVHPEIGTAHQLFTQLVRYTSMCREVDILPFQIVHIHSDHRGTQQHGTEPGGTA